MRQLLVLSFALCMAAVLLVGGARWVGALQPQPAVLEGLRLSDCSLPCWVGITPGKTTLDEAYERMTEVFFAVNDLTPTDVGRYENLSLVLPIANDRAYALPVFIYADDEQVEMIQLFITGRRQLTLADVILAYGAPTCVFPSQPPAVFGWRLYYETPTGSAEINAYGSLGNRFDHRQAIYSIVLRSAEWDSICFIEGVESLPRWRGFGPGSLYRLRQL